MSYIQTGEVSSSQKVATEVGDDRFSTANVLAYMIDRRRRETEKITSVPAEVLQLA